MKSQKEEVQRELISSTKNNNNDWVLNGCIVYESGKKTKFWPKQWQRYDKITR
jgi:hypothetical protein